MDDAREKVDQALTSGAGLNTFRKMVEAQGGDPRVCDEPESVLEQAGTISPMVADSDGFVCDVNAEKIGRAVLVLGGGRRKSDDLIDPAVGISGLVQIGERVAKGNPLMQIHSNDPGRLKQAEDLLENAITLSDTAPAADSVILERILPS